MKNRKMFFVLSIVLLAALMSTTATATTINYMVSGGSPFSDAVLRILPEFEEATGIKVNVIEIPYEQTFPKALLEARNKTGAYDVIQINRPFLAAFAEPGYLMPLEDYIPDIIEGLFEVHRNYVTFDDGHVYAVPHSVDIRALYYRTDMLEEAGLDGPPKNWQEMLEYSQILTNSSAGTYGLAIAGSPKGPGVWVMADFIHQAGGSIVDDNGKPVINSEEAVKGVTFMTELLTKYRVVPPGTPNYVWADLRTIFPQGNIGMVQEFNDIIPLLNNPSTSTIMGKYDLAPIPGDVRQGTNIGGWLVAIPNGAKNPEAAAKLIEFIMSPRAQIEMCRRSGTLTAMEPILDQLIAEGDSSLPKVDPYSKDRWAFYKDIIETAYDFPRTVVHAQVETILGEALSDIFAGFVSPKEALDEAQLRLEDILN